MSEAKKIENLRTHIVSLNVSISKLKDTIKKKNKMLAMVKGNHCVATISEMNDRLLEIERESIELKKKIRDNDELVNTINRLSAENGAHKRKIARLMNKQ